MSVSNEFVIARPVDSTASPVKHTHFSLKTLAGNTRNFFQQCRVRYCIVHGSHKGKTRTHDVADMQTKSEHKTNLIGWP